MSALSQALDAYLALRQALGFQVQEPQRLLRRFVDFLEREGADHIDSELALRWASASHSARSAESSKRLTLVRGFARFRAAKDPRTQIPATGLLTARPQRASPYLYRDCEVAQLLQAAAQLPSPTGLRARTYVAAFGLLAVTGMRVGELVALDDRDVDPTHGHLTIRQGKFGKERWLPLHPSTQDALRQYVAVRDRCFPIGQDPSFLVSEQGTRLTHWSLRYTFVMLSRQIGLRGPADSHGPRLHDFRHRFAVEALLRWYREGIAQGASLSPDGVNYLLQKHLACAHRQCPSLAEKHVTPHVLRHSAAMALLHSGVDCAVIAMWLGHESMETTQIYLHASLELKRQALDKTTPTSGAPGRYRPDDALLGFLKSL